MATLTCKCSLRMADEAILERRIALGQSSLSTFLRNSCLEVGAMVGNLAAEFEPIDWMDLLEFVLW